MQLGLIGGGSWATAIAKIITENNNSLFWYLRNNNTVNHIQQRKHNPHYLSNISFNTSLLQLGYSLQEVVEKSDTIIIAVPAAFIEETLKSLPANVFEGKTIISAVKGIIPHNNLLLNDHLKEQFHVALENYYTLLGPCHSEEVASEKLSYLTFSGLDAITTKNIADYFKTSYTNIVINTDVIGVQYAAVLKNIYAIGAGIAHGLDYGDNFLSVYSANAAEEMKIFLNKISKCTSNINCNASVYLGDLLVTCYSLHSRNRTLGAMVGKGYSVKAAQLEMNMVAEGYNASKCINEINKTVQAHIPIAKTIYEILWEQAAAEESFKKIEDILI